MRTQAEVAIETALDAQERCGRPSSDFNFSHTCPERVVATHLSFHRQKVERRSRFSFPACCRKAARTVSKEAGAAAASVEEALGRKIQAMEKEQNGRLDDACVP